MSTISTRQSQYLDTTDEGTEGNKENDEKLTFWTTDRAKLPEPESSDDGSPVPDESELSNWWGW